MTYDKGSDSFVLDYQPTHVFDRVGVTIVEPARCGAIFCFVNVVTSVSEIR